MRSFVPPGGRILIPATGAYADRMTRLAREAGRVPVPLPMRADRRHRPAERWPALCSAIRRSPMSAWSTARPAAAWCTTSPAIGAGGPARSGRRMIVDAVSAFGALPLDLSGACRRSTRRSSPPTNASRALPGIAFAVARIDRLEACAGQAGSWSFDLPDIYDHALRSGRGQLPLHAAGAGRSRRCDVALDLLEAEGGSAARLARYTANMRTLYDGVRALGLTPCLPPRSRGRSSSTSMRRTIRPGICSVSSMH